MLHRCDKCHSSTFNNHHYKDMCFAEMAYNVFNKDNKNDKDNKLKSKIENEL